MGAANWRHIPKTIGLCLHKPITSFYLHGGTVRVRLDASSPRTNLLRRARSKWISRLLWLDLGSTHHAPIRLCNRKWIGRRSCGNPFRAAHRICGRLAGTCILALLAACLRWRCWLSWVRPIGRTNENNGFVLAQTHNTLMPFAWTCKGHCFYLCWLLPECIRGTEE